MFINFITIADEEWIAENLPMTVMAEQMKAGNPEPVLKMLWRLMDEDTKVAIKDYEVKVMDGFEEKSLTFTDPIVKMKHVIQANELVQVLDVLFLSKKLSLPDPALNEKKNLVVDVP